MQSYRGGGSETIGLVTERNKLRGANKTAERYYRSIGDTDNAERSKNHKEVIDDLNRSIRNGDIEFRDGTRHFINADKYVAGGIVPARANEKEATGIKYVYSGPDKHGLRRIVGADVETVDPGHRRVDRKDNNSPLPGRDAESQRNREYGTNRREYFKKEKDILKRGSENNDNSKSTTNPNKTSNEKPKTSAFKKFKDYHDAMKKWRKSKAVKESVEYELTDYIEFVCEGM